MLLLIFESAHVVDFFIRKEDDLKKYKDASLFIYPNTSAAGRDSIRKENLLQHAVAGDTIKLQSFEEWQQKRGH
jgi:hypothetical protein